MLKTISIILLCTLQIVASDEKQSIVELDLEVGAADTARSITAHGDFNNDGYDDLIFSFIGVDSEAEEFLDGRVVVTYGSVQGLKDANKQIFQQTTDGIVPLPFNTEPHKDRGFGTSLSTGDYNHDGYTDLIIGNSTRDHKSGSITVLYGSSSGLTTTNSKMFNQDSKGIPGTVEVNDLFGSTLSSGDYNNDGYTDLAIGIINEGLMHNRIHGTHRAGGITILYGSSIGLTTDSALWIDQDVRGVPGSVESNDHFGKVLNSGDYNDDGYDDLAIGIPNESLASQYPPRDYNKRAGAVTILYGSESGIDTTKSQWFDQDSKGIPGDIEEEDKFGETLSTGDFNNDGIADLAIGISERLLTWGGTRIYNPGALTVLYGSKKGLKATKDTKWIDQGSKGIQGDPEHRDFFGSALSSGDFNNDGYSDLLVGVPGESLYYKYSDTGVTHILYGSEHGITGLHSKWIEQTTALHFGRALTSGDFNGDNHLDIVIASHSFKEPITIFIGTSTGDIKNSIILKSKK